MLIKVWEGNGEKTFVHVHQNETTALKAAMVIRKEEGAGLLTLVHSGGRNIEFTLNHQHYAFDPNRIYTDKGLKTTLKTYGHYSPEAYQAVKHLADEIVSHIPKGRIVAVHNNKGYSIRDYLPGHPLEHDAKSIHLTSKSYYRNFYLTTESQKFEYLKHLGFNGILQAESVKDDGSLSVRLSNQSYVNIEAGYNQLAAQMTMLRVA